MLTRPPVVFVHGINSGPNVWEGFSTTGQPNMAAVLQSQGYIIEATSFADHSTSDGGMGPLTTDWTYVQSAVEHTLQAFRAGGVKYSTDGPGNALSTNLALGTLIAVQKVDVVAHSYGGLLTRWYMEQATGTSGGKLFEDFRNIRTLVELGTPNLGSPLANMIDEIYKNPLIANADINSSTFAALAGPTEVDLLKWLGQTHYFGLLSPPPLPTSADGSTAIPFL
ncbi:MAG: esterase/lipase family protein [Phycisphaerae bacterium]